MIFVLQRSPICKVYAALKKKINKLLYSLYQKSLAEKTHSFSFDF